MSLLWLTMSKALARPIILVNVRSAGQGWLKPCAILCVKGRMANTVEWLGRKQYWLDESESKLSSGYKRRSKTCNLCLTWLPTSAGQRLEITSTQISWFIRFGNKGYNWIFPYGVNIAVIDWEVGPKHGNYNHRSKYLLTVGNFHVTYTHQYGTFVSGQKVNWKKLSHYFI